MRGEEGIFIVFFESVTLQGGRIYLFIFPLIFTSGIKKAFYAVSFTKKLQKELQKTSKNFKTACQFYKKNEKTSKNFKKLQKLQKLQKNFNFLKTA